MLRLAFNTCMHDVAMRCAFAAPAVHGAGNPNDAYRPVHTCRMGATTSAARCMHGQVNEDGSRCKPVVEGRRPCMVPAFAPALHRCKRMATRQATLWRRSRTGQAATWQASWAARRLAAAAGPTPPATTASCRLRWLSCPRTWTKSAASSRSSSRARGAGSTALWRWCRRNGLDPTHARHRCICLQAACAALAAWCHACIYGLRVV